VFLGVDVRDHLDLLLLERAGLVAAQAVTGPMTAGGAA
jgi:hypothetical protein